MSWNKPVVGISLPRFHWPLPYVPVRYHAAINTVVNWAIILAIVAVIAVIIVGTF